MRAVQCAWTLGHGINIEIVVMCVPSPISMLQPMWDCLQVECLLHQRRGSYSVCTAGFDILRFVAEIQLLPALTLHSIFSHFIFLFKVKQKQQKWATISDIHSSSQQATIYMLWQTRLWPECGCVLLVCRHSPHHDNIIFEDLRAQATKVGFCWTFLSLDSFDLRLKEL